MYSIHIGHSKLSLKQRLQRCWKHPEKLIMKIVLFHTVIVIISFLFVNSINTYIEQIPVNHFTFVADSVVPKSSIDFDLQNITENQTVNQMCWRKCK